MTFKLLEVKDEIIRALKEDGIYDPNEIQKLAIPHIKEGRDVIGMSKTGSGKTAAFGVPILDNVKPGDGLQVLVLAPTRELAIQTKNEFQKFAKYLHCNVTSVYGGVSLEPQVRAMERAEVITATTGRTVDHIKRGNLDLSNLKCIVLDEADKMVEMGFIEDIEFILQQIKGKRQVLLFGATISHEIERLKSEHMNNPVVARAELNVKKDFLEQCYYDVMPHEKFSLLVHLLKTEKMDRAIIFCSTKSNVDLLAKNLKLNEIKAAAIHGDLAQNKRLKVIEGFNNDRPRILVASAVAARGLDIRNVSHIFNYDLSRDPQEYIHRVGRTARAGETGVAITLLGPRDHEAFYHIQRKYDVDVTRLDKGDFPILKFQRGHKRRGRDYRGGNRSFGRKQNRTGSNHRQNSRSEGKRNNRPGKRNFRRGGFRR